MKNLFIVLLLLTSYCQAQVNLAPPSNNTLTNGVISGSTSINTTVGATIGGNILPDAAGIRNIGSGSLQYNTINVNNVAANGGNLSAPTIYPVTTGTYDLGQTIFKWRNLYLSGTGLFGGATDNGTDKLQIAGSQRIVGASNGGTAVNNGLTISSNTASPVYVTASDNLLTVVGTGSSASTWKGRITAGGDVTKFLMGEYNSQAWLGAHNSALNAWADLYINAGGGNVILGSNATNVVSYGNLNLGTNNAQLQFGGTRFLHNYGTNNTFVGSGSGNTSLTGSGNTVLGAGSGTGFTTGSNNTLLGNNIVLANQHTNSIFIGNGAGLSEASSSNTAFIGNSATPVSLKTYGTLSVGATIPNPYSSARNGLFFGQSGLVEGINNSNDLSLNNNIYHNGTNDTYKTNGFGSLLSLNSAGGYIFYTAISGTAGAAASLLNRFQIANNGGVGIGATVPSTLDGSQLFIGLSGNIYASASSNNVGTQNNLYSTNGVINNYKQTGFASSFNQDVTGSFLWFTAPSGSANTAATVTQRMQLSNSGNLVVNTGSVTATKFFVSAINTAPTSSTDTGTTGEIRICNNGIYWCIATNSWLKAAGSTF